MTSRVDMAQGESADGRQIKPLTMARSRTVGVEQNTLSVLMRYSSLRKEDTAMTQMDR